MRPFVLEIAALFRRVITYRHQPASLGALNSAVAFSIAMVSSGASIRPRKAALLAILYTCQMIGFGDSGFLGHARSISRELCTFNPVIRWTGPRSSG
jgi:hypothetical protein